MPAIRAFPSRPRQGLPLPSLRPEPPLTYVDTRASPRLTGRTLASHTVAILAFCPRLNSHASRASPTSAFHTRLATPCLPGHASTNQTKHCSTDLALPCPTVACRPRRTVQTMASPDPASPWRPNRDTHPGDPYRASPCQPCQAAPTVHDHGRPKLGRTHQTAHPRPHQAGQTQAYRRLNIRSSHHHARPAMPVRRIDVPGPAPAFQPMPRLSGRTKPQRTVPGSDLPQQDKQDLANTHPT